MFLNQNCTAMLQAGAIAQAVVRGNVGIRERIMKYRHLSGFDAVVRCGGIRAAAREMQLTQGALTKTIRELEAEFGAPLIVRGAQGVTLTKNGRVLAERARVAVAQVTAAQDTFNQLRGADAGTLRIALSATILETIFPALIQRLSLRMPGVRVRVSEASMSTSIADLRAGHLDIAVLGLGATHFGGDLAVEPMLRVGKSIVGRPEHPLLASSSVRDLVDATWALSEAPVNNEDPMYGFFLGNGADLPRNVIECNNLHAALSLAEKSDVITAVPNILLSPGAAGSKLVRFQINEALPPSTYALVRRADAPLTPAAQAAVDAVRYYSARLTEEGI